jgi:hypothetical protein
MQVATYKENGYLVPNTPNTRVSELLQEFLPLFPWIDEDGVIFRLCCLLANNLSRKV